MKNIPRLILENGDLALSAMWAAQAVNAVMSGVWPIAPIFLILSWEALKDRRHKKRVEKLHEMYHAQFQIIAECCDELAAELGKHAGPKIANDIVRRHLQRMQDENKKNQDPPKAGNTEKKGISLFNPLGSEA